MFKGKDVSSIKRQDNESLEMRGNRERYAQVMDAKRSTVKKKDKKPHK